MTDATSIIPGTWVQATIGDICSQPQYGYTTKAAKTGDLRLLRTTDITSGRISWETVPYCSENPDDPERYLLRDGDIVVSRAGSVGVSHLVRKPQKAIFASYLIRFRPFIDRRFLGYFLESPDYWVAIADKKLGIAVHNVNATKLKSIAISIPPVSEQTCIVAKIEELFSSLDKGIESLKTARAQLNVYRQAVLKHAFEGKLTAQWREENKDKLETPEQMLARIKHERAARYEQQVKEWKAAVKEWEAKGRPGKKPGKSKKPTEIAYIPYDLIAKLPQLPEGWLWVRVGDCCDVVRGGSPRPAGDTRYYNGKIPFLKVADLTRTEGVFLDTHCFSIKEAGLNKTRLVEPPILMLSNSGATLGVPKVCRIKTTFNDGIAAFLGLDPDDLHYHYYFWASKTFQLRAINQGAAQPNLNTDLIKETLIPLCTHEEMQIVANHIGRSLSMCDQLVAEVESQLLKTDALRQSILKTAFAGQLVAQDPGDEPVSVLLDRIKAEKERDSKNGETNKMTRKKRKTAA